MPDAAVAGGALPTALLGAALIGVGWRPPRAGACPALFGMIALAGLASGLASGHAGRRACTASLEGGTPVLLEGTLADRLPAAGREDARGSGRLVDAVVIAEGRWCRVGAVRITMPRADEPATPGTRVAARGSWRRSGESRLPRPASRYGYVSATSWEPLDGGGRVGPLARLRGLLAARLDRRLRTEVLGGVAKALILADRTTLDREVRQRFIDAGIVHLLAISGLHVGMIAAGIVWILGLRDRGPRRWVRAVAAVAVYVLLIGAPPAATRAALIFAGHAYCRWRGFPGRVADLAGLAAILAVALNPLIILDPGFQLSFAGFVGVIAGHRFGERFRSGLRRLPVAPWLERPREAVASTLGLAIASTGAFLCTAPIAAVHFGRVVATSIPASVASTGLVGLALPSVAAAALLPGWPGDVAADAAFALLSVLVALADAFAGVPLRWRARPETGWFWLACGALALAALASPRRRRPVYALALAGVVAAGLLRPAVARLAGPGTPLLCTLSVGQGDAAVLRTSGGRWLLFDAGPGTSILDGRELSERDRRLAGWMRDAGRDVIVPFLRARGVRDIELFVLSHPHLDHFGGAGAVFEGFRVHGVLDPGVVEPSEAYLALLERTDEERALWVRGTAGDEIVVDDIRLTVLWPVADARDGANDASLSFRLEVGDFAYVNTGDAPVESERAILENAGPDDLAADLLKLGHHGSHTSSSVAWLRAVRPEIAVMSLGRDNRYGHPHAETLHRLDSARVRRIWRTDREGTLCVEVLPDGWRIVDG